MRWYTIVIMVVFWTVWGIALIYICCGCCSMSSSFSARNLGRSSLDSIHSFRRRFRRPVSDEEDARKRWQWHRHLAAVSDFDQKRRVTTGWQGQRIRTDALQGQEYSWTAIAGASRELQSRRDPWLALIGIGKRARKVFISQHPPFHLFTLMSK
jgi:hypothetical protein